MRNLEELYKELDIYKNLDEDGNDEKFLKTVDEIVKINKAESIGEILKYFNDNESSWVLESANSAIEHFNNEIYVKEITKNLHIMLPHAKEWAAGMIYGVLNNKECLEIFKQNLHLAQKEQLLELLDKIYEESENHRPLITELKQLLNKNEN